ncbi:hypothetical protein SGPA1_21417 [Streptomyces misionensis JCM 4497]
MQHAVPGPADGGRHRPTARQSAAGRLVRPRGARERAPARDHGQGGDPRAARGRRRVRPRPGPPCPGAPAGPPGARGTAGHPGGGAAGPGAVRLRPAGRPAGPDRGVHGHAGVPDVTGAPRPVRARAGPSRRPAPPPSAAGPTGRLRQPVPAAAAHGGGVHGGAVGGRGGRAGGGQPQGGGPRDRQGGAGRHRRGARADAARARRARTAPPPGRRPAGAGPGHARLAVPVHGGRSRGVDRDHRGRPVRDVLRQLGAHAAPRAARGHPPVSRAGRRGESRP